MEDKTPLDLNSNFIGDQGAQRIADEVRRYRAARGHTVSRQGDQGSRNKESHQRRPRSTTGHITEHEVVRGQIRQTTRTGSDGAGAHRHN